ncbi:MAG: DUF5606 domain-containing protein [Brumimicrobium sp.]|nr:DUF5606 domain-containing protein [Brumimicrobium sp.]
MDLSGIISISGKPGLFKVVAQAKNNIIVESLVDGKRSPAYSTDRISALEDISIYTYEEDVALKEVFTAIYKKENGKETISHKESADKLTARLKEILPNYDAERVYTSDIKKLFQWYNILTKAGALKLEEKEADKEKKESKDKKSDKETSAKKTPAKKTADKKKPAPKKPAAASAKKTAAKPSTKKAANTKQTSAKKK